MNEECEYGKATRDRLEWFVDEWTRWKTNDFAHFQQHIYKKVDKLRNSFSNRPSWSLFSMIMILSNLVTALIMFILTKLTGG